METQPKLDQEPSKVPPNEMIEGDQQTETINLLKPEDIQEKPMIESNPP